MTKKRSSNRLSLADLPDVITPEQFAAVTGIHPNTVRNMCKRGEIQAQLVGSHWFLNKQNTLGKLLPQEPTIDAQSAMLIVDAIKDAIEKGLTVSIQIKGGSNVS